MAYNNYFPQNQYQQQYYPQYQQIQPMQMQTTQPVQPMPQAQNVPQESNGIIWVQGESAARSFMVGAGKSVLLMDSDSSTFYLKSTDMSGMPQPLRIFDYTERTTQPQTNQIIDAPSKDIDTSMFVTKDELEERLAKLSVTKPSTKSVATVKG